MTIAAAVDRLRTLLGPDRLSTSNGVRDQHAHNESWFDLAMPDAVAFPESTEEVAAIVRVCAEEGCPIVPWGVGTSLEGHALCMQGGISLDMGRMNRVLSVNAEDMDAVVQPGITRKGLNEHIRDTGLFFPVDPGADATIGGMAATRASGTCAVRYGTMRDAVLGVEAVLGTGEVIRAGSRARKSSSGYDLKNLLVGSEGTLGILTEVTVRLHGVPESVTAATCAFETVEGAVDSVIQTIQMGIPVARIELVDAASIDVINGYSKTDLPRKPHLFLEFHGTEAGTAEQAEMFGEIAAEHGGAGFAWAATLEERNRLWNARHNYAYALRAGHPGRKALTTDVCVPISQLAASVRSFAEDIAASPLDGYIIGHAGDGNFHGSLIMDPERPEDLAEAKRLAHRMNERALAAGGTVTGEHGIGRGKMIYMEAEHGAAWGVMGRIKKTFDPAGILNPGKVVEVN